MRAPALLAALLMALALPGGAQEAERAPDPITEPNVIADVSQGRIDIGTRFAGSEILIFGAVIHEAPRPPEPFDVIVTVSGPLVPVTVRRKDRVGPIWVNVEAAEIDLAPSFYAVATSGPLREVLTWTEDIRRGITAERVIRAVDTGAFDALAFTEALRRIRTRAGAYTLDEGSVEISEGTLFRTAIALPADLTEGSYATRIHLARGGEILASYATAVEVEKVGLERFLYRLAHDRPALYGLMSLAIAILAGWGASAAFTAFRR